MIKSIFGKYLRRCAKTSISRSKPYIIGITGSVGKTSSRMIISHILQQSLLDIQISTSPKNFNTDIGLALSILDIQQYSPTILGTISVFFQALHNTFVPSRTYDVVVLEYGIDQPGDMDALLDIAVPHMAIFTGLDKVHASAFESPDEILEEKSGLLLGAEDIVFVPAGVTYLDEIVSEIEVDVLSYALGSDIEADISFSGYVLSKDDENIHTIFEIDQGHEEVAQIRSNLIGEVSAGYTSLGIEIAMIVARRMGVEYISPDRLVFSLQPGRFGIFHGIQENILIDGSYNAAPKSMKLAIQQSIQLRNDLFPDHKLLYCLGDMNELGDFAEAEHRELALLVTQSAEHIFLVGDEMQYLVDEAKKIGYSPDRISHHIHAREMGGAVLNLIQDSDQKYIILTKASQGNLYIEEVLPFLLLDKDDIGSLPRQSKRRMNKKSSFFEKIDNGAKK